MSPQNAPCNVRARARVSCEFPEHDRQRRTAPDAVVERLLPPQPVPRRYRALPAVLGSQEHLRWTLGALLMDSADCSRADGRSEGRGRAEMANRGVQCDRWHPRSACHTRTPVRELAPSKRWLGRARALTTRTRSSVTLHPMMSHPLSRLFILRFSCSSFNSLQAALAASYHVSSQGQRQVRRAELVRLPVT